MPGRSRVVSRTVIRSHLRYSGIKSVNISKVRTNSVFSMWHVPLGRTPDYLDPQSQEALYEVDVSGMALHFSFGQRPEGETIRSLE